MATSYFKNISEIDKFIINNICRQIENDGIFCVSTDKKFKLLGRESSLYTYDYTYNFIRFGFATKARNTDFHAKQHPYCPNHYIAQIIANFINKAVEMGYYVRTTEKVFNGGNEPQIIWM